MTLEDKNLQRPQKGLDRARNMEAHRWEQSFESFVLEQKETLLDGIKMAKNWQDVHQVFEATRPDAQGKRCWPGHRARQASHEGQHSTLKLLKELAGKAFWGV